MTLRPKFFAQTGMHQRGKAPNQTHVRHRAESQPQPAAQPIGDKKRVKLYLKSFAEFISVIQLQDFDCFQKFSLLKMPKIVKRSWTWKYFVKEGEMCRCAKCPYTHKPKDGTTSAMAHHLRIIHKLSPDMDSDSDSDDGNADALPGPSGSKHKTEGADKVS